MSYQFRLMSGAPVAPVAPKQYDFIGKLDLCEEWLQTAIQDYHNACERDDDFDREYYSAMIDDISEDIKRLKMGIPVEGI